MGGLKTSAFVVGLGIGVLGLVGIVAPSSLAWLAREFVTFGPVGFYVAAIIRIVIGFILISVASASRTPKALRVLGYVVLIAGIATALAGLMAIGAAQGAIEWWLGQGANAFRLSAVLILAIGSFIAYACAPTRGTR